MTERIGQSGFGLVKYYWMPSISLDYAAESVNDSSFRKDLLRLNDMVYILIINGAP